MILQLVDVFVPSNFCPIRLTATKALGFNFWEKHMKVKKIYK